MSDIVVVNQENKTVAAFNGLMGELSTNSRGMYARAIEDFQLYAQQQGRAAFGDNLAVLLSDYLRYLRDSGLAGSTVQVKRIQLRRFFEWLARTGVINQSALYEARSVKTPKIQGKKAGTWLSGSQMQALLSAPDSSTLRGLRDRAIFALLMGTAIRRSELTSLTWGHLVEYEGRVVIKNLSRKAGRNQPYVPVPFWVKKAIDAYSERGNDTDRIIVSIDQYGNPGKSITPIGIYNIVVSYTQTLGYGKITPHDLRRSWAKAAKEGGLDLTQIQQQLGHNSVETTQRYINETMDVRAIADVLEMTVD